MRKILKEIVIAFFILSLIFIFLDFYYTKTISNSNYQKNKAQFALNLKNTKTDYIILGNSRAFNSLSTNIIDKQLKTKGLNLGINGTGLAENLMIFDAFLENNNTTKMLILEITFSALQNETYSEFSFPEYLPYIDDEKIYSAFIETYGKRKAFALRYIPFYKYALYNGFWRIQDILRTSISKNYSYHYFDNSGNLFLPTGTFHCSKNEKSIIKTTKKNSKLQEILSLCKKNNIDVLLYTAPYYNLNVEKKTLHQLIEANLKNYDYYDFTDKFKKQEKYFRDCGHINKNGGTILTKTMIPIIQNKLKN